MHVGKVIRRKVLITGSYDRRGDSPELPAYLLVRQDESTKDAIGRMLRRKGLQSVVRSDGYDRSSTGHFYATYAVTAGRSAGRDVFSPDMEFIIETNERMPD